MNEKQWNEFMSQHNPTIDKLAHGLLKCPCGSLTWEDLAQEAKLHIWKSLNASGMIHAMAKRYMLNMIRHEKVDQKHSKTLAKYIGEDETL